MREIKINISDTSKKIIINMIIIFFVALTAIFFIKFIWSYIIGLFIGTFISIARLILLDRAINKSLDMPKETAQKYIYAQYMLRYILTGLVLFLVITNKNINKNISAVGFIIGLLSLQIATYMTGFNKNKK